MGQLSVILYHLPYYIQPGYEEAGRKVGGAPCDGSLDFMLQSVTSHSRISNRGEMWHLLFNYHSDNVAKLEGNETGFKETSQVTIPVVH